MTEISKLAGLKRQAQKEGWAHLIKYDVDERALLEGYTFDWDAAHAVEEFITGFCILPKSKEPFQLMQWQLDDIVYPLFGWMGPNGFRRFKRGYAEIPKKNGKALALDTKVPTPLGFKEIGEIQVGDTVYAADGSQSKVIATSEVFQNHKCYRVTFQNGESFIADRDHRWKVRSHNWDIKVGGERRTMERVVDTEQLFHYQNKYTQPNMSVRASGAIQNKERELSIEPYLLGYWLGGGPSDQPRLSASKEDSSCLESQLGRLGVKYESRPDRARYGYYLHGLSGEDSYETKLRGLNLLNNKHIPSDYLFSSEGQRWELLKGLLDSNGTCSKSGQIKFVSSSRRLAYDLFSLASSLSLKATIKRKVSQARGKDRACYRVQFYTDRECFYLKRKSSRQRAIHKTRHEWISIKSVERVKSVPTKCIGIDHPSHLFLIGETFIPTHNTTLWGAIGNYMLFADGELGAEVYNCANDIQQSYLLWNVAADIVESSDYLSPQAQVVRSRYRIVKDTQSWFASWSSKATSKDGPNIHCAIVDELHEWGGAGREFWQKIRYGGIAREQPICPFVITTAGTDKFSLCYEQHEYAKSLIEGRNTSDFSFLAVIYAANEQRMREDPDYWKSEQAWKEANPSYGIILKKEGFEQDVAEVENDPKTKAQFFRYRLNYWTEAESPYIPHHVWIKNRKEVDEESLLGEPCACGLDLSSVDDTTSYALVFPYEAPNPYYKPDHEPVEDDSGEETEESKELRQKMWRRFRILPRVFCPEEKILERSRVQNVRYDAWRDLGWVYPTPGDVIDHAEVLEKLIEDYKKFKIKEVIYDRHGSDWIVSQIESRMSGVEVEPFGQGFLSMNGPTKDTYRFAKQTRLEFSKNEMLDWQIKNAICDIDAAGNWKLHKGKSKDKIDLAVALVQGIKGAVDLDLTVSFSVYGSGYNRELKKKR